MRLRKIIASTIYNTLLKCGIEIKRVRGFGIKTTPTGDIAFALGNFHLTAPSDHALPGLLKQFPDYSWSLGRVSKLLEKTYENLLVIDIGANIGDSAAIIRNYSTARIVCVEGNPDYYKYLLQNIRSLPGVSAFQEFLGEEKKSLAVSIEENQGTIRILPKKGTVHITLSTLDDFIQRHSEYKLARLLKIDADGYDLQIIRGGKNYIRNTKPVIHFEYAKFYFEEFGDNGLETLQSLARWGYETAVLYDNFGRFILSTDMLNTQLLRQVDGYLTNGSGAFSYVDMVVFHKQDRKIAEQFVKMEESRNGKKRT